MDFLEAARDAGYTGARRWYTALDVARITGVGLAALGEETKAGRLRCRRDRRHGNAPKYKAEWVQAWLDSAGTEWWR